jgi:hypothetical protein
MWCSLAPNAILTARNRNQMAVEGETLAQPIPAGGPPVLTAAAAVVMLGGSVMTFDIIGGGMALAGVVCAQTFRRPIIHRTAIALGKNR